MALKNRKALCIGINAYSVKPLNNAINDATSIHEILKYKGYESSLEIDLDYSGIHQSVDKFCKSINKETEAIIFFFSGHGVEKNNINYLLPSDINEAPLEYGGYKLEDIFNVINNTCNEDVIKIIILDACRSDKEKELLEQLSRANNINEINLGQVQPSNQKKNYLIAFSTSPGNSAYDGEDKKDLTNGIYTKALVKSFKNYNIPIEDMLKDIREEVLKKSDYKQLPWEHSSLNKKFYLDFKSHHQYLVDIKEIPFNIINNILFVNDTQYIVIGNSPLLCLYNITKPHRDIQIPIVSSRFQKKKLELEENDQKIIDLFNKDDSNIEDVAELAEKLNSDLSINDLRNGKREIPIEDIIKDEIKDIGLVSIAKSKNYMVLASSIGDIFIFDKKHVDEIETNTNDHIDSITISDDERYCAFCHKKSFTVMELDSKKINTTESKYLDNIYSLSFMPDSKDIILCGAVNSLELIKNFNTSNESRKEIKTDYYTYNVKFTPNKKKMITTHNRGTINIWDVETLKVIGTIQLSEIITNQVTILNIKKESNEIPSNHITSLSVVNDTLIAVGTYNVSYCLMDIEHYRIIKEYPINLSNITPYGLSCNNKYLVCNGYSRTVYIHSIDDNISYINESDYFSYNDHDPLEEFIKLFNDNEK